MDFKGKKYLKMGIQVKIRTKLRYENAFQSIHFSARWIGDNF